MYVGLCIHIWRVWSQNVFGHFRSLFGYNITFDFIFKNLYCMLIVWNNIETTQQLLIISWGLQEVNVCLFCCCWNVFKCLDQYCSGDWSRIFPVLLGLVNFLDIIKQALYHSKTQGYFWSSVRSERHKPSSWVKWTQKMVYI